MKFSMTGQEKGDLSIQVTSWAGLTVFDFVVDVQSLETSCMYTTDLQ
jgi:hypothetical protein